MTLHLEGKGDFTLANWALKRKSRLFEESFRIAIDVPRIKTTAARKSSHCRSGQHPLVHATFAKTGRTCRRADSRSRKGHPQPLLFPR